MDLSYIINHLGENREQYFNAVSPPIMQSSNFTFNDIEQMRQSLKDELNIPFYTRGGNPTVTMLRQKIAALEHAERLEGLGAWHPFVDHHGRRRRLDAERAQPHDAGATPVAATSVERRVGAPAQASLAVTSGDGERETEESHADQGESLAHAILHP